MESPFQYPEGENVAWLSSVAANVNDNLSEPLRSGRECGEVLATSYIQRKEDKLPDPFKS